MNNRSSELDNLINSSFENHIQQEITFHGIFSDNNIKLTKLTETLKLLNMYLSDRARGIITLIDANLGWDAEIVLRSYYECFCKILYFCSAGSELEQQLIEEFWGDMEEVSTRRTSRKATFAKEIFSPEKRSERDVFEALESKKFTDIGINTSKASRKIVEQRWSFTQIVEYLDSNPDEQSRLKGAKSLLHIYGLASHLIHADASALRLHIDRSSRPAAEKLLLEEGHHSRILSDLASLGFFALHSTQSRLKTTSNEIAKLHACYQDVAMKSGILQKKFSDSQRSFYDEFLNRN